MARAWCLLAIVGACVTPTQAIDEPPPSAGEVARYRIEEGDTLTAIADRLSFPGGWRALAAANPQVRRDTIRTGASLRVPIAYLREAGLDPYMDFGLEPDVAARPAESLIACPAAASSGACTTFAGARLCVEATEPADAALADPDPDENALEAGCVDTPDGTIECPWQPGRVLVAYAGGERRELIELPQVGDLDAEWRVVDLDGDGRPELVAAVPIEIDNHEGWQTWREIVIDDAGAPVASFDDAQWGEGSLIEAPHAGDGCDLLVTQWSWIDHPIDGEGMYFTGRRFAYRRGALVPQGGEVVRRMRTYFHVACDDCDGLGPQSPAAWLSAPEASWWPELGDGAPVRTEERGTIVGASVVDGSVAIEVLLGDRRLTLDPRASAYDDWRPPDVRPLDWIRLGPDGGQLPEAFVPAALDAWIGRPALFEERGDADAVDGGDDAPSHVLWIDPPPPS